MKKTQSDIDDNEIRIVSRGRIRDGISQTRKRWGWIIIIASIIALVIGTLIAVNHDSVDNIASSQTGSLTESVITDAKSQGRGYGVAKDTVINDIGLTLITPVNCTPDLVVGASAMNGNTDAVVCQGPDLRADNGGIVGMCVVDGSLLSRGESKSGYCAIVDGRIILGISQSAPVLEQVLETGGSFFRQYPLVAGNQVVQNKPKGKSIRKALALIGGRHIVIVSKERISFGQFSESLCELGVDTAIYLVGSDAPGYYRTEDGHKEYMGRHGGREIENMVFLVWR